MTSLTWPKAKVETFITSDRRWNLDLLKLILNDHTIISRIIGVPIPVGEVEDSMSWGLNSSGEFTMKSTTWHAHGIQPPVDNH